MLSPGFVKKLQFGQLDLGTLKIVLVENKVGFESINNTQKVI